MVTTNAITVNATFSGDVLELDVLVSEEYSAPDFHLATQDIKYELYEYSPASSSDPDPYTLVYSDDPSYLDPDVQEMDGGQTNQMSYRKWRFVSSHNRLVKWVVKVPKYIYDNTNPVPLQELNLCCANLDGEYYVLEGYSVDMKQYEENILDSINLQCNNCEVPKDLVTRLLRLFTVRMAADAGSEYLEMIFSKLVCNGRYNMVVTTHSPTHNCGCHG